MHKFQKFKKILTISIVGLAIFLSTWKIWEDKVIFTDELFIEDISYGFSKGEWLVAPMIGGRPDLSKPPLLYWITGMAYKFSEPNLLIRRLPNMIFSLVLILTTYYFVKKYYDTKKALISIILLTTNAIFLIFSKAANFDYPAAVIGFLALYFYNLGKSKNEYYYLASACLGLSFLTRSFLSFFPLLVIVYDLTRSKLRLDFKTLIVSLLIYFVITLPWVVFIYLNYKDYFFGQFINLVFSKHFTGLIEGDVATTPFYYLTLFLLFPLLFLLPLAIMKKRKKLSNIDSQMIFWIVIGLVILSVSKTRHLWYGVFLIIPGSVLVADYLADFDFGFRIDSVKSILSKTLLGIGLVIYPVYFLIYGPLETDVAQAIKTYKSVNVDSKAVYFWKYSLAPTTRFYPEINIDVLDYEKLVTIDSSKNNYLIIRPWDIGEIESKEIIYRGTDTSLIKIVNQ